jgi:DNA-binding transcriptional LysR family regulator
MRGTQFARLSAFIAVAEHSSFTRAAAQLGVSPPSISLAVRSLEEQFGVRLLNRTSRSVVLTEAGEHLLGHLNPLMDGFSRAIDAVNAFRDKPAGTLRLVVHPIAAVMIVGPLVACFSREYPEIRLHVCIDDGRKDVVSGRFDAAIHPHDGIGQDMVAVPVGQKLHPRTVASPAYVARGRPLSGPDSLTQHNCIDYCWSGDDVGHPWRFRSAGREMDVNVRGSLNVNSLDLALRAGLDGLGIVQLPDLLVAPYLADGSLVEVLPDWTPCWPDFVLFYPMARHTPAKLRALVNFMRREAKVSPRPPSRTQVPADHRLASEFRSGRVPVHRNTGQPAQHCH